MSKRFRQIAKPPVDESLLLLKNLIRRSKKTVEDGSQAVCSQHTRTPPRRHALSTRAGAAASRGRGLRGGLERARVRAASVKREQNSGARAGGGGLRDAGRGRVRVVDGRESGDEREAEAESGGAGNKTYLL